MYDYHVQLIPWIMHH